MSARSKDLAAFGRFCFFHEWKGWCEKFCQNTRAFLTGRALRRTWAGSATGHIPALRKERPRRDDNYG
jgi:hypothetical protein